ncbi:MAG: sulfate ABC transporter ATP-binding protein [bacterium]
MSIEVRNITKRYASTEVLQDVSLDVRTGELIALLGPSGCGKTTLLRIIAGLEVPDAGQVICHAQDTTTQSHRDRRVGFVFQHYALFRHLTVFENVAFGLRARPKHERPPEEDIRRRVTALLELIQLPWLWNHLPDELSGGQRQRVALARALAIEPRVLLLDEPFGALDARVRIELRRWLRQRHADLGVTTIFVTHDQDEALEVADRVVVMDHGRIEQVGSPAEVYAHPATPFVCRFLGAVNVLPLPGPGGTKPVYVRPHELVLTREPTPDSVLGRVAVVSAAGPMVRVEVVLTGNERIEAILSHEQAETLRLELNDNLFVRARKWREYAK